MTRTPQVPPPWKVSVAASAKPTPRQYEATARHHERMADVFASYGRDEDRRAALAAAETCRRHATEAAR